MKRNASNSNRLINHLMKKRNASKFWIAWWSEMLQNLNRLMRRNASKLNHLMKRNASNSNRLMRRNAQITLNWIQLHHEMLKLREYVEWWDAAMKWRIERISDHVTQHHLIFICMRRLDFLHMRRSDSDQSLWDRFVPSICWFRNEVVLQLSDELIFWFYEDDRGIKHLRHGRTEMVDGWSTHGMAEPEMTEYGELWMGQLNPRGTETSVLGWLDRWAHRWDHRWSHRWDFRGGNFLYNEVDFPPRFSRQR
jgi:hypothetical protein